MKSELQKSKCRGAQFPIEALPEKLRLLCADQPVAATGALMVIAGAVGGSAKMWRTTTQEFFSPQMLLIIRVEGGQPEWLSGLLSPILEYQRHLLARTSLECDERALQAEEALIKGKREAFLQDDHFPEKAHMEYFDQQLRQVNLQRKQLFLMEHPLPGTLLDLFTRSPDQSLFLSWTNPHSFMENWSFWRATRGKQERDLIFRSLSGETFIQPVEDGGLILERPYLSGIAVCNGNCLKDLMAADSDLFTEPGLVFIVDDSLRTGKSASLASPMESLQWWHCLMQRLLDSRFDQQARQFSISAGAEEVLHSAHGREFLQLQKKYGFPPHVGADLSARLMLLLHLCQDDPGKTVSEATALSAVKIVCWLVAENHRVVTELKNEGLMEKRRADCARMLQKIREKGPLLKRELFRLFDIQTEAVHGPVLADLLQSGDVVKGADGRLRVSASEEKADKSESGATTVFETASTDTSDLIIANAKS